MKNAILISVNEDKINLQELSNYLNVNNKFYWPLTRKINPSRFDYPIKCYLHICKEQTEFVMVVENIVAYEKDLFKKISCGNIVSREIIDIFRNLDPSEYKKKGVMIVSKILKLDSPVQTNTIRTQRGAYIYCAPQHFYEIQDPLLKIVE